MGKHTPGPWAKHGGVIRSLGMNDRKVADVRVLDDEGQANASLIAAAPDLLEALTGLVEACTKEWIMDEFPVFQVPYAAALAAIAKARGKS